MAAAAVTVQGQLVRYIAELEETAVTDSFAFWAVRRSSCTLLAPLAEDLLMAPASQAFVERIFVPMEATYNRAAQPHIQVVGNASIS